MFVHVWCGGNCAKRAPGSFSGRGSCWELAAGFQLMVGKNLKDAIFQFLNKLGFINGHFALGRTEELDFQDLFLTGSVFYFS